jgi:hypothetical protein
MEGQELGMTCVALEQPERMPEYATWSRITIQEAVESVRGRMEDLVRAVDGQ